jgi:hypothetical protein
MDLAYRLPQEWSITSGLGNDGLELGRRVYSPMPGYVLLLALAFKVLGTGLLQARALSVAFGVVTIALTFTLGERLWGKRVGLVAVVLMVANFQVFAFSRQVMPEIITLALGLAALAAYLYALEGGKLVWFGLSGLASGLALLCHPLGLPIMVGLAVWLWLDRSQTPKWAWAWLMIGAAVPLVPYVVYVLVDLQEYLAGIAIYNKAHKHRSLLATVFWELPGRYFGINKPNAFENLLLGKFNMYYWLPQVGLVGLTTLAGIFVAVFWAPRKDWGRLAALMVLYALFMTFFPNKFQGYLVMQAPFVSLVMAGLILRWGNSHIEAFSRKPSEWAVLALVGIFVLSQALVIGRSLTASPVLKVNYFERMAKLRLMIPEGDSVLANPYYWIGLNDGRRFITGHNFTYALEKRLKPLGRPYWELTVHKRQELIEETFKQFRPSYLILTKAYGIESVGRKKLSREITPDVAEYLSRRAQVIHEWPIGDGYKNHAEHYWKGVKLYRIPWGAPRGNNRKKDQDGN